jgi:hypothetical protein
MPARNKIASEIIDQLGGSTAFAEWYGASRNAVHWWRTYGFPAHSFPELSARLKAEKKISADPAAWHLVRKSKKRPLARKRKPPAKGGSAARVSA